MLVYVAYVKVYHNCIQISVASYAPFLNLHTTIVTFDRHNFSLILGVKLEHGPNQESNNTLITVNDTKVEGLVLFC